MKNHCVFLLLLGLFALGPVACPAETNELSIGSSKRFDLHFTRPAPNATSAEAVRRLGVKGTGRNYALAAEKFQVIVPSPFSTNVSWGLLLWISPGDTPGIPSDWEAELARQQLLVVGAYKSGNQRDVMDRARLALDAVFNMRQLYKIDPNRIYVAGFSGGGRVAGMLGVTYADVFTGTICVCGVGFYTDIPTPTGEHWPRTYTPEASQLARAKSDRRFVLITGDQDINRENTHAVWRSGFESEGFRHVQYLEVPGLQHTLPSAEILATALGFVVTEKAP